MTEPPTRATAASQPETGRIVDSKPIPGGPFAKFPMRFGRYEILKELGRGQMGAVYLAKDLELDRFVALKVARTSASNSERLIKRMQIEAKAAARIDHPLICKVYDAGEIEGIRFIALQYVEGEDLKRFMKRTGRRQEPNEAVRIVLQILRALKSAHEKGIIHRDLKPENVMLNKSNDPVIMDFGLARNLIVSGDAGLTQGMIVGTAAYMSPEQAVGKADGIDHRSDLYAVGVILFEMLTGDWPFTGSAMEVMGRKCVLDPPSPLSLNSALNPNLAAVCEKLIAKQKEDRFDSPAEAVVALEAINLSNPDMFDDVIDLSEGETLYDLTMTQPAMPVLPKPPRKTASPKSPRPKSKPATSIKSEPNRKETVATWYWAAIVTFVASGVALPAILILQYLFTKTAQKPDIPLIQDETKQASHNVEEQGQLPEPISIASRANETLTGQSTPEPFPSSQIPLPVSNSQLPNTSGSANDEKMSSGPPKPPSAIGEEMKNKPDSAPMSKDGNAEPTANPGDRSTQDLDGLIMAAASLVREAKEAKGKDGQSKFREATLALKQASNLYPRDLRGDFCLGILNSGIGVNDRTDAELYFKRVLDRSPGHIPALNNLALVSIKSKKFQQARNYFAAACKASPRPFEINQNLGRVIDQAKPLDISARDLRGFKSLHTEPAAYRPKTGWLYMPLDDSAKSQDECKSFCRDESLEDPS